MIDRQDSGRIVRIFAIITIAMLIVQFFAGMYANLFVATWDAPDVSSFLTATGFLLAILSYGIGRPFIRKQAGT